MSDEILKFLNPNEVILYTGSVSLDDRVLRQATDTNGNIVAI